MKNTVEQRPLGLHSSNNNKCLLVNLLENLPASELLSLVFILGVHYNQEQSYFGTASKSYIKRKHNI